MTTLQDTFLVATNNTVSADVLTGHCFQNESLKQGCTNPGPQVATTITFCMVALNIFGPSTWNLPYIDLLEPKISSGAPRVLQNLCTPAPK